MRLAYTHSETPGEMNAALRGLAERLKSDGIRSVGAVQINTAPDQDSALDMELFLLPDGPMVRISQSLGAGSDGCRLDPDGLEHSVAEAERRLSDGADVLIVNKFGGHEAEGRGFRDLIGTALGDGIPVVIGVSSAAIPAFLKFAQGLAERLPCDPAALTVWVQKARSAGL